jgi:hypothetical protein
MLTKEIEMSTTKRSRTAISVFAALFTVALSTPLMVQAEDQIIGAEDQVIALAPVAGPSWDETSGYGAVEASRATIGHPVLSTTLEQTRMAAAERALLTGDIGSMQEESLLAIVAAAPSWDETSGYGSIETSRAANALPAVPDATTTAEETRALAVQQRLQSYDVGGLQEEALLAVVVTGSPWDETSGYGSVEASRAVIGHPIAITTAEADRVLAAQQALLSHDLGSLQEEALAAVVAGSIGEADASVDAGLAPTNAELLAQFRAVELALSRSLGAD